MPEESRSSPDGAAPVFDPAQLAQLRQLDRSGRAGFLRRVLVTFGESLDTQCRLAEQGRAAGDPQQLRSIAHMLKSSSASVGAKEYAQTCVEIEEALRKLDGDSNLDALYERFFRASSVVRDALRGILMQSDT